MADSKAKAKRFFIRLIGNSMWSEVPKENFVLLAQKSGFSGEQSFTDNKVYGIIAATPPDDRRGKT